MLYLVRGTNEGNLGQERAWPIADLTAVALERALVAADSATAQRELTTALVSDPALGLWAIRTAKLHAVTTATVSEAAAFLSPGLVQFLLAAVQSRCSHSIERVSASEAAGYARASLHVLLEARKAAHGDGESDTNSDLAHSKAFASSLTTAVERFEAGETNFEAREPLDALAYYFVSEQPGIEWRLPALVRKLADCEARVADFDRRLEHEKLESLKELAYGASHEINNPLANIAARAQTLLVDENDSERRRKLTAIHRQAMRAHEMIADLMLYARPPKLEAGRCDLRSIVERIMDEVCDEAAEREIQIESRFESETLEITADGTQIAVAIKALVSNALEAIGAGGHVDVSVREIDAGEARRAKVTVADDGPGISEAAGRHLFDPFFSGREAGRGLGFGLSKCWRIVTDHRGQVIVHRSPRRGAEISILLPMEKKALVVGVSDAD